MSPDDLVYGPDGLVPAIIQDAGSGAVLTLAYANREAVASTLAERVTVLYSRSRQALWRKGESSGHTQRLVELRYDCDADALLYRVEPAGPACHTGATTCFEGRLDAPEGSAVTTASPAAEPSAGSAVFAAALGHLAATFASRKAAVAAGTAPAESYVAKMLRDGVDRIAKKVGEEATEVVIAAKNDDRAELTWETADLLFHTMLLLEERGVSLDDVGAELLRRAK